MSVRKFHLQVSGPGQKDIDDILAYTLENCGERQRAIYKAKIDNALEVIENDPYKGRKTVPGMHMVKVEKHRIFSRVEHETIIVVRILHQRMDEARHLT